MYRKRIHYFLMVALVAGWYSCKQEYTPPAIKTDVNYLVVEGVIKNGQDSTIISLSRTRRLSDSTHSSRPEPNAIVTVEQENGPAFPLPSLGNGRYGTAPLLLDRTKKYRLRIQTPGGFYHSDYVVVKDTPPIDSISWEQPSDLSFFINTHDPANNTRYYRWEYDESWEYQSIYNSIYIYDNGAVRFRDSAELVYTCYRKVGSNNIILGTSVQLSSDLIQRLHLITLPLHSGKLQIKYSLNVNQYALTREAFNYWQELKKLSEQLGSLFDVQPSRLIGNIHSDTDPGEPVIGFVSISSVASKRIFLSRFDLTNWNPQPEFSCPPTFLPADSAIRYLDLHPNFGIAYGVSGGGYALTRHECYDCTVQGGTTLKPSYWP